MRSLLAKVLALFLVFSLSVSLAACQSSQSDTSPETSSEPIVSGEPANFSPMEKYDPEITIHMGGIQSAASKFEEGQSFEDNVQTRLVKDELGINIVYDWVAMDTQAPEKINIVIASGDIPDVMMVDLPALSKLYDSDLINDNLGQIFEQYASEAFKDFYTVAGGAEELDSCSFDGKLAGLPAPYDVVDENASFAWVRSDWLTKLDLPVPTNWDELMNVMDAFVNDDPDGNGEDDTYGIALMNDSFGASIWMNLKGFFNAYHSYPRAWVEDSSGNLVYGSFQPETKLALEKLSELYNKGYIDKEFSVKDIWKENELAVSGKVGIMYGVYSSIVPLQKVVDADPSADWIPLPVFSADDKQALAGVSVNVTRVTVFRKDFEYPEALIKMTNLFLDKGFGPDATTDDFLTYVQNSSNGIIAWTYGMPWCMLPPGKNLDIYRKLRDNRLDELNAEGQSMLDTIESYNSGNNSAWWIAKAYEIGTGPFQLIDDIVNNGTYLVDGFYGVPTDTMNEKLPLIQQLELEMMTSIVMGNEPLSEFDNYVERANEIGLEEITQDVNDWYSSRK